MRLGYPETSELTAMSRSAIREGFLNSPAGLDAAALIELGWPDLLAEDPYAAIRSVFEEQGATLGQSDALALLTSWALGSPSAQDDADADPSIAVALWRRPAGYADQHDRWLAPTLSAGAAGEIICLDRLSSRRAAAAELEVTKFASLDPSLTVWQAVARSGSADSVDERDEPDELSRVRAAVSLALACELVGAAGHVLQQASNHAMTRTQFGVPIGTFQAVQVLLADAAVDLAAAIEVVAGELREVRSPADLDRRTGGAVVLTLACRAGQSVCASAQQVFGAISYTREHEFHRYFRRILVLSELAGVFDLPSVIGQRMAATGDLPLVGPVDVDDLVASRE